MTTLRKKPIKNDNYTDFDEKRVKEIMNKVNSC